MKNIFLSFIILWILCSCDNQLNATESYAIFNKIKAEYLAGNFDEKKYLDKWISVPLSNENIDFNMTKKEEAIIYKAMKEAYPKAYYVGIVQLEKFKINRYYKKDKEKEIVQKVKVLKTIKGIVKKRMTFS